MSSTRDTGSCESLIVFLTLWVVSASARQADGLCPRGLESHRCRCCIARWCKCFCPEPRSSNHEPSLRYQSLQGVILKSSQRQSIHFLLIFRRTSITSLFTIIRHSATCVLRLSRTLGIYEDFRDCLRIQHNAFGPSPQTSLSGSSLVFTLGSSRTSSSCWFPIDAALFHHLLWRPRVKRQSLSLCSGSALWNMFGIEVVHTDFSVKDLCLLPALQTNWGSCMIIVFTCAMKCHETWCTDERTQRTH